MAGIPTRPTPTLLVTANVGSIFEDPSMMLKLWTQEFLSTVARLDPKFIALHCQEVGGKNYEQSMKHVEYFVRLLMSSDELRLFDKIRVYLDEDFSSAEKFTALGNFYFIHESITDVLIWDFKEMGFVPAKGKEVHSGNIEDVATKEKSKFPQELFPECKWSRKGFLRTRWNLKGSMFDLVNIHLFHDASNFVAMETCPSVYCKNRKRALEYTLDRFHNDDYENAPFFVFGDFNFRTDTQGVVKKLAEGLNPVRIPSNKNNDHTKLQYRDGTSQVILSLGKKEFRHLDHQNMFITNAGDWLKEFDRELEPFQNRLFEFPISFPPSYPFEEDQKGARHYMQTRCPSWCDRVVLSQTAKSLVNNLSDDSNVQYGVIGRDTCMGDHKPVYLKFDLLAEAGIVNCCDPDSPCGDYLPSSEISCSEFDIVHEPYTPDSIDDESFTFFDASQEDVHGMDAKDTPLDEIVAQNIALTKDSNAREEHKSELPSFDAASSSNPENQRSDHKQTRLFKYPIMRVKSATIMDTKRNQQVDRAACRCFSDATWSSGKKPIRPPYPLVSSNSRIRLISEPSLYSSRIQSHHSSSDEEWFEEVMDDSDSLSTNLKSVPCNDSIDLHHKNSIASDVTVTSENSKDSVIDRICCDRKQSSDSCRIVRDTVEVAITDPSSKKHAVSRKHFCCCTLL